MTIPRIGVAISTMNRRELFFDTLSHWRNNLPEGAVLVVVDDASDVSLEDIDGVTVVRHDYRRGVAMTKNRCIAELMDAGVDHLFLSDDDVHPLTDEWWKPYVESPEPHLSYQWTRGYRWRVSHGDDRHWSISFPRGVMLYAERRVIDTVGGMDAAHGAWGGEHVEWSQRIHDNGLTRWPFADVRGSDQLWFAHDQNGNSTNSTFTLTDRVMMAERNGVIWGKHRNIPVSYREGEGEQDYQLGPRLADTYHGALEHALGMRPIGAALEFGVGSGNTLRLIARHMPVVGFDSFEGLPEDWREGFPRGMFACEAPYVSGASLVIGRYEDTLPGFNFDNMEIGLVHIDCDLYSSTVTVLEHIGYLLKPGVIVVFDEWHGYDGSEAHEERAWRQFADRTWITWTVVGHGPEQWCIRIT